YPETRIQDQSILSMVFIAAAKLDFKILCNYRVNLELPERFSGGASDGNFTAAMGKPTLCGIGAIIRIILLPGAAHPAPGQRLPVEQTIRHRPLENL
ncbi:hypothetical protein D1BOALGB6SA_6580, partial [Olavius sp. associated proteobacterium Delta 1]